MVTLTLQNYGGGGVSVVGGAKKANPCSSVLLGCGVNITKFANKVRIYANNCFNHITLFFLSYSEYWWEYFIYFSDGNKWLFTSNK